MNSLLNCHNESMEQDYTSRGHLLSLVKLVDRKINKGTFELVRDLVASDTIQERLEYVTELVEKILALLRIQVTLNVGLILVLDKG